MIDHVNLYVKDYAKAKDFFSKALQPLGYSLLMEFGQSAGFGEEGKPDFWINQTPDTFRATHVALTAENRSAVDEFYRAAIVAGGKDNGAPGIRENYSPTYYASFVHDLDGNNIEVVCHKG